VIGALDREAEQSIGPIGVDAHADQHDVGAGDQLDLDPIGFAGLPHRRNYYRKKLGAQGMLDGPLSPRD
jgi:hypothetical protein